MNIIFPILIIILSLSKADALEASVSLSQDKTRVVVGNTITFTATVKSSSALYAMEYDISYDSSLMTIVSGSTSGAPTLNGVKSKTITWKFKAKKSGTAKLKVNIRPSDGDNSVNKTVSKSVKIITQSELEASYSSNNNLSTLSIEDAKINPKFSKTITSYTVELPANTETIKINGKVEDSKASVTGLGKHTVEDGKNVIEIKVTAENGSTKTYSITANVKELDPIKVKVNGNDYTVIRKQKLLKTLNENFKENTTTINNQEIPSLYNEKANITLIGLKDEEGNINLYIYDKYNEKYTLYNQFNFNSLTLYIEDKEVENYKNIKTIDVNENEVKMYTLNNKNYLYFYGINLETGKENIYSYEEEEKTIQKVIDRTTKENKTIKSKDNSIYKLVILGLIIFIFLTYVIILLILIFKGRNKKTVINTAKEDKSEKNKIEKQKYEEDTANELRRINNSTTSETNELIDELNIVIKEKKSKKK